jgi:thioredoxin reductase (NADPH)
MTNNTTYDIAIVGGGPAGLSAAIYARRFNMKTIIFSPLGCTIEKTDLIENYPGFKSINGCDLAEKLKEHAKMYKPEFVEAFVDKIEKEKHLFNIHSNKKIYKAKSVIYCTGTEYRKLGVAGEKEFANKGVHYCAVCDGNFYKDKIVAVAGSGNSAAKDALMLSSIAKKVYLIARKTIHPEPINAERVHAAKNIVLVENTPIKEIAGDRKVRKIILEKPYEGKNELEIDGLFVDIGHAPITKHAKELGVKLNDKEEIIADCLTKTSMQGFFVAGDVANFPFKQAIIASSQGCIAAYSAYEYITKEHINLYN